MIPVGTRKRRWVGSPPGGTLAARSSTPFNNRSFIASSAGDRVACCSDRETEDDHDDIAVDLIAGRDEESKETHELNPAEALVQEAAYPADEQDEAEEAGHGREGSFAGAGGHESDGSARSWTADPASVCDAEPKPPVGEGVVVLKYLVASGMHGYGRVL